MTKRDMYSELLEGFESLQQEREGKLTLRSVEVTVLPEPRIEAEELKQIRDRLNISQNVFAQQLRLNARSYHRWEREGISGPQATLIKLVDNHPELLQEIAKI